MTPFRFAFAVSFFVASSFFVSSHASSSSMPTPTPAPLPTTTPKPMKPKRAPITFSLKTDKKTYVVGEKINLTMTVRNVSKTTQPLTFGSGQSFDVIAWSAQGTPVWEWARGLRFTMMVREESLDAGKTQVYSAVWDSKDNNGKDNNGQALAPGVYRLDARLKSIEQRLTAAPVFITVKAHGK